MKLFIAPGFLVWAGLCLVASAFAIFFLVPRYGKKTMLVHIGICSLIGGLSVSCTQGLGAAILTSIRGNNQVHSALCLSRLPFLPSLKELSDPPTSCLASAKVTFWFFWFLFVFVIGTLLTEINYLNKALELFNTRSALSQGPSQKFARSLMTCPSPPAWSSRLTLSCSPLRPSSRPSSCVPAA